MESYKLIKEIGNGAFGCVWLAINKQSGQAVAVKKMKKKFYSWEECVNLREVKSLRKMNHPHIVALKEVIRENDILYFVFEFMECNVYELMKDREKLFAESQVKQWCFQVFQGLAYMHQNGYFHRDLKPENLLVAKNIIKIADFGLAREIDSQPPYTEYVSTRWYRAPEVLLQSNSYTSKVDMWAMGAIIAELFTLRPLFPGNSEADEIYKICTVIGSPNMGSWSDGLKLARSINFQFPQSRGVHLSTIIPSASEDAVDLIRLLCSWDPSKRPSASEALQHPFFKSCFYVPPSLRSTITVTKTPPSGAIQPGLEQYSARKSYAVQRSLNMVHEDTAKSFVKQPKYRPPGRKSPNSYNKGVPASQVMDVGNMLSSMTIGSQRQSVGQPQSVAVKNGGVEWNCGYRGSAQPTRADRGYCIRRVVR